MAFFIGYIYTPLSKSFISMNNCNTALLSMMAALKLCYRAGKKMAFFKCTKYILGNVYWNFMDTLYAQRYYVHFLLQIPSRADSSKEGQVSLHR